MSYSISSKLSFVIPVCTSVHVGEAGALLGIEHR